MPLVANIITRSGSTSDADFRQHDGRVMVSMTFCMAVGGFRGWNPLGEGVEKDEGRSPAKPGMTFGWNEGEASPIVDKL